MKEDCTIYKWLVTNEHGVSYPIHATTRDALGYLDWIKECCGVDAWLNLQAKSDTPELAQPVAYWVNALRLIQEKEAQERADQTAEPIQ